MEHFYGTEPVGANGKKVESYCKRLKGSTPCSMKPSVRKLSCTFLCRPHYLEAVGMEVLEACEKCRKQDRKNANEACSEI